MGAITMSFISSLVFNLLPIIFFVIACVNARKGKKYKVFIIIGIIAGISPLFGAVAQMYRDNGFGEYKYTLADLAVFLAALIISVLILYRNCNSCEEENGESACKISSEGRKTVKTVVLIGSILIMVLSYLYLPKVCAGTEIVRKGAYKLQLTEPEKPNLSDGKTSMYELRKSVYDVNLSAFKRDTNVYKESLNSRFKSGEYKEQYPNVFFDAYTYRVDYKTTDLYKFYRNGYAEKNFEPFDYKGQANIFLALILATIAGMIILTVLASKKKNIPIQATAQNVSDKRLDNPPEQQNTDIKPAETDKTIIETKPVSPAFEENSKPKENIHEKEDETSPIQEPELKDSELSTSIGSTANVEKKEETATITDVADSLLKYKQLLDMGAISEEEYNEIKSKLLKF